MRKTFKLLEIEEKEFIELLKSKGFKIRSDKNLFYDGYFISYDNNRYYISTRNKYKKESNRARQLKIVKDLKIKISDFYRLSVFFVLLFSFILLVYDKISFSITDIIFLLISFLILLSLTYITDYVYYIFHWSTESKFKRKIAEVLKEYVKNNIQKS